MSSACVRFEFDPSLSLLIFTASGRLDHLQIIDCSNRAFAAHAAVSTIWDLTGADLSELSHHRLQEIIDATKPINERRPMGAKTGLAASREDVRALLGLFRALNFNAPSHIDYRVFDSVREATDWIAGDSGNATIGSIA